MMAKRDSANLLPRGSYRVEVGDVLIVYADNSAEEL